MSCNGIVLPEANSGTEEEEPEDDSSGDPVLEGPRRGSWPAAKEVSDARKKNVLGFQGMSCRCSCWCAIAMQERKAAGKEGDVRIRTRCLNICGPPQLQGQRKNLGLAAAQSA